MNPFAYVKHSEHKRYRDGNAADCAAARMRPLFANHGCRDGLKRAGTVAGTVLRSAGGVGVPDGPTLGGAGPFLQVEGSRCSSG